MLKLVLQAPAAKTTLLRGRSRTPVPAPGAYASWDGEKPQHPSRNAEHHTPTTPNHTQPPPSPQCQSQMPRKRNSAWLCVGLTSNGSRLPPAWHSHSESELAKRTFVSGTGRHLNCPIVPSLDRLFSAHERIWCICLRIYQRRSLLYNYTCKPT